MVFSCDTVDAGKVVEDICVFWFTWGSYWCQNPPPPTHTPHPRFDQTHSIKGMERRLIKSWTQIEDSYNRCVSAHQMGGEKKRGRDGGMREKKENRPLIFKHTFVGLYRLPFLRSISVKDGIKQIKQCTNQWENWLFDFPFTGFVQLCDSFTD